MFVSVQKSVALQERVWGINLKKKEWNLLHSINYKNTLYNLNSALRLLFYMFLQISILVLTSTLVRIVFGAISFQIKFSRLLELQEAVQVRVLRHNFRLASFPFLASLLVALSIKRGVVNFSRKELFIIFHSGVFHYFLQSHDVKKIKM